VVVEYVTSCARDNANAHCALQRAINCARGTGRSELDGHRMDSAFLAARSPVLSHAN